MPLLNLRFISGVTPFRWHNSITLTHTYPLISRI